MSSHLTLTRRKPTEAALSWPRASTMLPTLMIAAAALAVSMRQLSGDGCETRTEQSYGRAGKYGDEQINDDYQEYIEPADTTLSRHPVT